MLDFIQGNTLNLKSSLRWADEGEKKKTSCGVSEQNRKFVLLWRGDPIPYLGSLASMLDFIQGNTLNLKSSLRWADEGEKKKTSCGVSEQNRKFVLLWRGDEMSKLRSVLG
ncbi:hypothetical protein QE152_g14297 [Popillia japonica]|uniref:Uncharacterized protein n=1 Tax=Popillia japonica TaxID=7064 RepID=A0AAW1LAN7_POPJA